MKKILVLLSVSFILLFSCAKEGSGNYINIAISSEPPTLDVMVNTSLISRIIAVGNIYERVVVLDGDEHIRPELATNYELSSDGKSLTFSLRDNVMFHDGTLMTADDVAASLNRWLDRYSAAESFVHGSRFYSIGSNTIAIESSSSLTLFPFLLASAPQSAVIMPKRIIDGLEEGELVNEYIGTGPYRLSSWKSGESIILEKFPEYKSYADQSNGIWGKKEANIENLVYYFVSDSATRRIGLQSGQYDFINDVMSDDRAIFEKDNSISILEGGESGSIALVFNKKEGIGRDLLFRKGVSLALDYDSLLKACYGDYGYAVHSDYMEKEQMLWTVDGVNRYMGQDIPLAKDYISKSQYSGEKFRILTSNLSNLDKIAIAMASDLKKVGIDSEIISVDWASMIELRKNPSAWDIYISAFSRVPLPQMKSYLSPSFPGWIDEDDRGVVILNQMSQVANLDVASSLWRDAQKELWESIPAIIPGHYITAYASRDSIEGVINQDGFFFWNARKVH